MIGAALTPPDLCHKIANVLGAKRFLVGRKKVFLIHTSKYFFQCSYGMTETSPITTCVEAEDTIEVKASSVGKAMDHTELKIVDTEDRQVFYLSLALVS